MGFEKLRVYQAAELLDAEAKRLLAGRPKTEDVKQLEDALGSLLFNIPEAASSMYAGRKRYHLEVARGSVDEARAELRRLVAAGRLEEHDILKPCALTSAIAKMLTAWIKATPDK